MENGARRYLIAIGSPAAPGLRFLDGVAKDVSRVTSLFCSASLGYQRVLDDTIPLGSPAETVKDTILDWFSHSSRLYSDLVILYFAGHGGDLGHAGNYYLFTSDTNETTPSKTAINVGRFIQDLYEGEGERPQSLLIILDACYSGKGAAQTIAQSAFVSQQGGFRDGAGLWIIATADSSSQAQDGAFVDAVTAAFTDPAWAPEGGAEYLNPVDLLVYGANDWLYRKGYIQQAEWDVLGNRSRPAFLRNPKYTKKFDGAPLLDEEHWDPKARGVEDVHSQGWFFTGRQQALRSLLAWLNSPQSDSRARVVTGRPGSGKSSVLARLVTSANPVKRKLMIEKGILDLADGTVPHENQIDAYIHARGLSAEGTAIAIAEQVRLPGRSIDELLASVSNHSSALRIIVDALDETQEPHEVEFLLLRKLSNLPNVRLIAGTRKQLGSVPFAGACEFIDLDVQPYFESGDIEQYVFSRLTATLQSAYSDPSQHRNARRIAEAIASRAGFSFLYARIVSHTLAMDKAPLDTEQRDWIYNLFLPSDLGEAFDLELVRFSEADRRAFEDLLIPLAWARGKGLPQKSLWAAIASSISGRVYTNAEIQKLKTNAGYLLVQDTENEQVVYRLFHEAFAEHIREMSRDKEVDCHFVDVLTAFLDSLENGRVDWSRVLDEYILHYLPSHAAAADRLDPLVTDVNFLLHFPPESLTPQLRSVHSDKALAISRAYRAVSHHLKQSQLPIKISYLLLAANQHGADGVILALERLTQVLRPQWAVNWVTWSPRTPSEVVVEFEEPITKWSYTTDNNRISSFVAVHGDTISVCDAITSSEFVRSKPLGIAVEYLACLQDDDKYWIVVAGTKPHDLTSDQSRASLITLHYPSCGVHSQVQNAHVSGWSALRGFCSLRHAGTPMVASAGADLALRLWSVPTLDLIAESDIADIPATSSLATGQSEGHSTLVLGGDCVRDGEHYESGTPVAIFKVPTLERLATAFSKDGGWVKHMVMFTLGHQMYVAAKYEFSGVRLLEIPSGRLEASTSWRLDVFGMLQRSDSSVLVFGEDYGRLLVMKIEECSGEAGLHVQINVPHSGVLAKGHSWIGPIWNGSRHLIVGAHRNQLRIWELEDVLEAKESPSSEKEFVAAAVVLVPERDVVITAQFDGSICVRSIATGETLAENKLRFSSYDYVTSMCGSALEGSPVVVVGTRNGWIYAVELQACEVLRAFQAGARVDAITSSVLGGLQLIFATTNLNEEGRKQEYVVTTWRIDSGKEKRWGEKEQWPDVGRLTFGGYADKTFGCISVTESESGLDLFAAGAYTFVRSWNLSNQGVTRRGDYWPTDHRGNEWIKTLDVGMLNGVAVVAAGNEEGILFIWDEATKREIGVVKEAHRGGITALALLEDGDGLITSGGDGYLRVWSSTLTLLLEVDLEEAAIRLLVPSDFRNRVVVVTRSRLLALQLNL